MYRTASIALACMTLAACGGGEGAAPVAASDPEYLDALLLGGDTTDTSLSSSAFGFSAAAANLSAEQLALHAVGDADFEQSFVPSGEPGKEDFWGLGPAFNNSSCEACHVRDGRGTPPLVGNSLSALSTSEGLLLRLSLVGGGGEGCVPALDNAWCAPTPVPDFGTQLFQRGLFATRTDTAFTGQAQIWARYDARTSNYPDGRAVSLRQPAFELRNPYDNPGELPGAASPVSRLLQADVRHSPRLGTPVFGLGLVEAIPEAAIVALADPDDRDGDGVSGRANYVYDPGKAQAGDLYPVSLGRLGWKANAANVRNQVAGALHGDMGLTSSLFPEESIVGTALHQDYLSRFPVDTGRRADGSPEVSDDFLDALVFYVRTLHVPARRQVKDVDVRQGGRLFASVGCSGCHHPSFVTGAHPAGINELANQKIYPFSDFLLHDMGPDLADDRSDFLASGREWRTRPLWGLGLAFTVNSLTGLLHDGRAKSVEEAVLWHGGEAEKVRDAFRALNVTERTQLLAFLNSL